MARAQVQGTEHVPDTLGSVVGRPQPARPTGGEPASAAAGLEVQRAELVHADHPAVGGRVVVKIEDPGHLGLKVRVIARFPGFRGLPLHSTGFEDLSDGFVADVGNTVDTQHVH
ncbi:hypothetical protein [Nocardia sp. NPDC004123]